MAFSKEQVTQLYENKIERMRQEIVEAREEGFRQGLKSAANTARLIGTEWWDHCAEPTASSAGYESAAKIADALDEQAKKNP